METFDIVIAGTGPAGLAAALALARDGAQVALVGPSANGHAQSGAAAVALADTRTAALFQGSLALLQHLGAWPDLEPECAPLKGIRIVDDGEGLLRAPEVMFEAHELRLPAFGANVPQTALARALWAASARQPNISYVAAQVAGIKVGPSIAIVELDNGSNISAPLVVAADGRNSVCRRAVGITEQVRDYPQIAIATQFAHSRDHRGISTEFHRASGPCTVVPMPGRRSSLVWVERPAIAARLNKLDDQAFAVALEASLHGVLGSISEVGPRRSFPLSCLKASALSRQRVVLVGEAGHALPPIGAQGLNLGFRDIAVIAELVAAARSAHQDIGGDDVLARYSALRQSDVSLRTTAVDLLNRSLLADMLPIDLARGVGLHLVGGFGALKRQVMKAGFEPTGDLPRLMRQPTSVPLGA